MLLQSALKQGMATLNSLKVSTRAKKK